MATIKSFVHPVANACALIIAVAAVTIWSARLEHRITGLEAAVRALALAPAAASPAAAGASAKQICANLALRLTGLLREPGGSPDTLQQLLRDAGCPNSAAK